MRWKLLAGFCTCCMPALAIAGSFDDALRKLEPEERLHQACIIKGLDTARRDARLRNADRKKTSIVNRAVLNVLDCQRRRGACKHPVVCAFAHLRPNVRSSGVTSFCFQL